MIWIQTCLTQNNIKVVLSYNLPRNTILKYMTAVTDEIKDFELRIENPRYDEIVDITKTNIFILKRPCSLR